MHYFECNFATRQGPKVKNKKKNPWHIIWEDANLNI